MTYFRTNGLIPDNRRELYEPFLLNVPQTSVRFTP